MVEANTYKNLDMIATMLKKATGIKSTMVGKDVLQIEEMGYSIVVGDDGKKLAVMDAQDSVVKEGGAKPLASWLIKAATKTDHYAFVEVVLDKYSAYLKVAENADVNKPLIEIFGNGDAKAETIEKIKEFFEAMKKMEKTDAIKSNRQPNFDEAENTETYDYVVLDKKAFKSLAAKYK